MYEAHGGNEMAYPTNVMGQTLELPSIYTSVKKKQLNRLNK